jgi:hypothetical protein
MPRSGLGKVREFGQAANLVSGTACGCALRRECAWRQPDVTGEHVTMLAAGKMHCRVPECGHTVSAPRGKICPLYQEGGARDVRSSSDASKGCSLAILETHCGHPQEAGVSQS